MIKVACITIILSIVLQYVSTGVYCNTIGHLWRVGCLIVINLVVWEAPSAIILDLLVVIWDILRDDRLLQNFAGFFLFCCVITIFHTILNSFSLINLLNQRCECRCSILRSCQGERCKQSKAKQGRETQRFPFHSGMLFPLATLSRFLRQFEQPKFHIHFLPEFLMN